MKFILGISAFYHDSAAVLLANGTILAAAQEERFSRKKHDDSFPAHAIRYVLEECGICGDMLSSVVFYEKPFLKFERLLETYHAFAPRGLSGFLAGVPMWIKDKLYMKNTLRKELAALGIEKPPIFFTEHHLSHAASAFFPSPFEEAAILTLDGVGEWATVSLGYGSGNAITVLKELRFPHSIGLLYSAATYYAGFKVNSGEYKLMGLAPYGISNCAEIARIREKILAEMIDIRDDGGVVLNMKYFKFATGLTMTDNRRWTNLLGFSPRVAESTISADYVHLAAAIQQITEEVLLRLANTAKDLTHSKNCVLAGGVALNCVANGRLLRQKIFDKIWVQPAAGDAGGALGAAFAGWYIRENNTRGVSSGSDCMKGMYLGPSFCDAFISRLQCNYGATCSHYKDFNQLCRLLSTLLAQGKIVGWVQGRMELGPRALGNRSILGDPRIADMQQKINLKIKFRESFRPFAPAILEEDMRAYFNLDEPSPYMLFTAPIIDGRRLGVGDKESALDCDSMTLPPTSDIPAVTHIDYSARVQTVNKTTNERFWTLLTSFKQLTGCPVLINTSFNTRGEPMVCTPDDAYRCFMRTEMDYLVIGDFLFDKQDQPASTATSQAVQGRFPLD